MLDSALKYYMSEPRRLENLGSTLATVGGVIILAGLFGHLTVTATSAVGSMASQPNMVKTLSEIYPALPTWWVPESIVGALPAILLATTGTWLNMVGKKLRRFLEY